MNHSAGIFAIACLAVAASASAQAPGFGGVDDPTRAGESQTLAVHVNEAISLAYGFGNTFLVTTSEGNVIIDTSSTRRAPAAKKLLQAVNDGPIRYIVLTHAHADHTGGVALWRQQGTQIIAQREHVEFVNYQARLTGFFGRRNSAQFGFPIPAPRAVARQSRRHDPRDAPLRRQGRLHARRRTL